jgi:hypothetical protein
MPRISEFNPELSESIKKEIEVPANLAELGLTQEDAGLLDYLKNKSIETVSKNEEELEKTVVAFRHQQQIPHPLPQGWFFKGGAARYCILKDMGEKVLEPLDWDFVVLDGFTPEPHSHEQMWKEYDRVREHYNKSDGIDSCSIEEYFSTRDFVVNEICANQDQVLATIGALRDLYRKKIRYSDHPGDNYDRLIGRSMRLEAEFRALYGDEGVRGWDIEYNDIDLFNLALHFDKAASLGDKVLAKFYLILLEAGVIDIDSGGYDAGGANIPELNADISYRMGSNFQFSDELEKRIRLITSQPEDDEYTLLARKYYIPEQVYKNEFEGRA